MKKRLVMGAVCCAIVLLTASICCFVVLKPRSQSSIVLENIEALANGEPQNYHVNEYKKDYDTCKLCTYRIEGENFDTYGTWYDCQTVFIWAWCYKGCGMK